MSFVIFFYKTLMLMPRNYIYRKLFASNNLYFFHLILLALGLQIIKEFFILYKKDKNKGI